MGEEKRERERENERGQGENQRIEMFLEQMTISTEQCCSSHTLLHKHSYHHL